MDQLACVYKVTCLIDGQIIIGSTHFIRTRAGAYKRLSGAIHNEGLYQSYLKHGARNHLFEILQTFPGTITAEELRKHEDLFVETFLSNGFSLFNVKYGSSKPRNGEEKAKVARAKGGYNSRYPFDCFIDDVFLKEFKSLNEAKNHFKLKSVTRIYHVLKGFKPFIELDIEGKKRFVSFKWKNHDPASKIIIKPVMQIDANGFIINCFQNPREAAAKTGVSTASNITNCAAGRLGKSGGYRWVYLENILDYSLTDEEQSLNNEIVNIMNEEKPTPDLEEEKQAVIGELKRQHNKRKSFKAKFISDWKEKNKKEKDK